MAQDPRLEGRPRTANERLLDLALQHAVFLERLKTHEAYEILAFLNREVLPEVRRELTVRIADMVEAGWDRGPATTARLEATRSWIRDTLAAATVTIAARQVESLAEIAVEEAAWQIRATQQALPAPIREVLVDFDVPTPEFLRTVVQTQPVQGRVLAEAWEALGNGTADEIVREVQVGLVRGEATDEIAARIFGRRAEEFSRGVVPTMRRQAEAIARTSVADLTSAAREETFKANADLYRGVKILATLDSRTCQQCMGLDGKVFPIGDGPRPAFHASCRCVATGVMRSWSELGLGRDLPPGTRASMNGQVPADLTYPDWLAQQSRRFQDEVLGPDRAELFRRGTVPIERFVDDRGRPLSLPELRALEARMSS